MDAKRMTTMAALVLGITVTCMLTGAGAAVGGDGGNELCMPPIARLIAGNIGRLLVLRSELNLTTEQRAKAFGLLKTHSSDIRPLAKKVVEKRRNLREAVLNNPADEASIRKAADELGKAVGDAAVLASKVLAEGKGVLTPAQVDRIREFRLSTDKATDEWVEHIGK
jgi:Spy/CpxP family protein refolding chaperone